MVLKLTSSEMRDFSRTEQTIWLYALFAEHGRKLWLTVHDSTLWEIACDCSVALDNVALQLREIGIEARVQMVEHRLHDR